MILRRRTRETDVSIEITEPSRIEITSGVPFLDHMLATLALHSGLGFVVKARGDLKHHLIEDVAITLGTLIRDALPARAARYGESTIAMDDALVQVVVDAGGRSHYEGPLPSTLYDHWMRSFAINAGITLHVRVIRGSDRHHIVEAAFKALGRALDVAMSTRSTLFSTKGVVVVERDGEVGT
ncbi:MAG: imidazoleglycerol-phosphate dehydratase [Gemmatimonadota bacterium]